MATPDLPEVPPGTETYGVDDDDVDATDLQMTTDGMITEPVLGIRMLMSSRVSYLSRSYTTCQAINTVWVISVPENIVRVCRVAGGFLLVD